MMCRWRLSPCRGKSVTVWQFIQRGSLNTVAIFRNTSSDRARASVATAFVASAATTVAKPTDQITAAVKTVAPKAGIRFVATKWRIVILDLNASYSETFGFAI